MINSTSINRQTVNGIVYSLVAIKDGSRVLYYEIGVKKSETAGWETSQYNKLGDAKAAFDAMVTPVVAPDVAKRQVKTARAIKAAATRKRNAELKAEREIVNAACADEIHRFNVAVAAGAKVVVDTAFGKYIVKGMNCDFVASCASVDGPTGWLHDRSFYFCNDYTWSDMLKQAGVVRNPRFAK